MLCKVPIVWLWFGLVNIPQVHVVVLLLLLVVGFVGFRQRLELVQLHLVVQQLMGLCLFFHLMSSCRFEIRLFVLEREGGVESMEDGALTCYEELIAKLFFHFIISK